MNLHDLIQKIDRQRKEQPIPPILGINEIARLIRVDHRTVRKAIKAGELPALRVGRDFRILRQDLSAWLRRMQAGQV
ncbi:helix-turn-helix domain-containing protein [Nannocystis pusilla]|uniref:helix-turn-helix domain-containing protein n=1 Tax=Nannocystis pusilla TaxID=889268 RepID=UPI003DA560F0